jgi:hypothetical protein
MKTTPTRQVSNMTSPITPRSTRSLVTNPEYPSLPQSSFNVSRERENQWLHVSDDEEEEKQLLQMVDEVSMPPPETPQKVAGTKANTSPGKRRFADFEEHERNPLNYGRTEYDVFNTPSRKSRGRSLFAGNAVPPTRKTEKASGLLSPGETPQAPRFHEGLASEPPIKTMIRDESPLGRKSKALPEEPITIKKEAEIPSAANPEIPSTALATEVLDALRDLDIKMTQQVVDSVRAVCHKHTLKSRGLERGRDISRVYVKKQAAKIAELELEIARLSRANKKY